jgi:hypothetical protein
MTPSQQQDYQACTTIVDAPMLPGDRPHARQKCETFNIISYTVMCRGGAVSAAAWWAASDQGRRSNVLFEGDTLSVPLRVSSGWGGSPGRGITGLQIGTGSVAYVALPSGYGFPLNLPMQSLTFNWRNPGIPVSGSVPESLPLPPLAPASVQAFASWYPWPQLALGLPLLAYGLIAFVGLRSEDVPPAQRTRGLIALGRLIFLAFKHVPAGFLPGQEAAGADMTCPRKGCWRGGVAQTSRGSCASSSTGWWNRSRPRRCNRPADAARYPHRAPPQ